MESLPWSKIVYVIFSPIFLYMNQQLLNRMGSTYKHKYKPRLNWSLHSFYPNICV